MKLVSTILVILVALPMLSAVALSDEAIRVYLTRNMTYDLENPVNKCESANPAIATCELVSARQVRITGAGLGKTALTVQREGGGEHKYYIRVKGFKKVYLEESVTLDLPKPVVRWNSENSALCKVTKITPTQLSIVGKMPGKTTLHIMEEGGGNQYYDISIQKPAKEGQQEIPTKNPATTPAQVESSVPTKIPLSEAPPPLQTVPAATSTAAARHVIGLHKTVNFNLSQAVNWCEPADPAIVECSVDSNNPRQVLITGSAMGSTTLTVRDNSGWQQHIDIHVKGYREIFLPRSILELPKPIQRCELATPAILGCSRLSPTRLEITGTTLGATELSVWEADGQLQTYDLQVKGYEVPLNKIAIATIEFPSQRQRTEEKLLQHAKRKGKDALVESPVRITPLMADPDIAKIIELKMGTPIVSESSTGRYRAALVLRGNKIGETSLVVLEGAGSSQSFDIRVSPDLGKLRQQIREAAPNDMITVEYANDSLVLSGIAGNDQTIKKIELLTRAYACKLEEIQTAKGETSAHSETNVNDTIPQVGQYKQMICKLVNLITIDRPQQVLLEIKVAQVDKNALKNLGITAFVKGASGEGFSGMAGSPQGFTESKITTDAGGAKQVFGKGIAGNAIGIDSITDLTPYQLGFSLFKPGIGAVLRALATKNLAKILAEPNLLVKSGHSGDFMAGSKIPYTVLQSSNGTTNTSIVWQDVGVKLKFKPVVLDNGLINLRIDPAEVSSIAGNLAVNGYPIIDSREVRTDVELREGESLVLAGLLQEETIKTLSKIPMMGDIPILGALFRSTEDQAKEKELVFFITPRLVTPTPPGVKTPLPTDVMLSPEQEKEFTWIPTN